MKQTILIVAIVLLILLLTACREKTQQISFSKIYGGPNEIHVGNSVIQTADLGYVIGGEGGRGGLDIIVVKMDREGNTKWARSYGGGGADGLGSLVQSKNGEFFLFGWTNSSPEFPVKGTDAYVIKTDSTGNVLWQKTYGTIGSDALNYGEECQDGSLIACGISQEKYYVLKLDQSGNELWHRNYSLGLSGSATGISQTMEGGFILAGTIATERDGRRVTSVSIVKTGPTGDTVWTRTLFYGETNTCAGLAICQDNGIVITGQVDAFYPLSQFGGVRDACLYKLDMNGNLVWKKVYGGSGDDGGLSVQQAADGGFIMTGYSASRSNGFADVYLVKTDIAGNMEWSKNYGTSDMDVGHSVRITSDGGYIVAGMSKQSGPSRTTGNRFYIIKTNDEGSVIFR